VCKLQQQVVFLGAVWGAARTQLYHEADLFVLPSFSENFGLVIAEALSCEVPVITTRATPWREIQQHRCGWWIEIGVEPLVAALKEAMKLSPDQLSQMGTRGRKLVASKYDWRAIGQRMVETYEWMLHRRDKPDCIQTKSWNAEI
jgi:glycosyltransferase involved in cell wall biosynthesis